MMTIEKLRKIKLTDEIFYLVGCACGDATLLIKKYGRRSKVNPKKKIKGYTKFAFDLTCKDKDFCERFNACLNKAFDLKLKVKKLVLDKSCSGREYKGLVFWRSRTQKKDVVLDIADLRKRVLKSLKSLKKSHKVELLRGMFDSDSLVSTHLRKGKYKEYKIGYANQQRDFALFCRLLRELKIKYGYVEDRKSCKVVMLKYEGFRKMVELFGGRLTIARKQNKVKGFGLE